MRNKRSIFHAKKPTSDPSTFPLGNIILIIMIAQIFVIIYDALSDLLVPNSVDSNTDPFQVWKTIY